MNKQLILDSLTRKMQGIRSTKNAIKNLPDDLPGSVVAWENIIAITIPYNIETFRKLRAQIGSGWKRGFLKSVTDKGEMQLSYYAKDESGVTLIVYLNPDAFGATCKKIQVGEKTIPVYEIVCRS